jgi:hypothetical protein
LDWITDAMQKTHAKWKTPLLCASLFTGAGLVLAALARVIAPEAVTPTVAIGLGVIGVLLILAAPPPDQVVQAKLPAREPAAAPSSEAPASSPAGEPTPVVAIRQPPAPAAPR